MSILDERRKILHSYNENSWIKISAREFLNASCDAKYSYCFEWLRSHPEFAIDKDIDNKLLISVACDGYLKRIR